jgi:hypothetical protein
MRGFRRAAQFFAVAFSHHTVQVPIGVPGMILGCWTIDWPMVPPVVEPVFCLIPVEISNINGSALDNNSRLTGWEGEDLTRCGQEPFGVKMKLWYY